MSFSARRGAAAVLLAAASVATVAGVRQAVGSDHQDTPEVELSPRLDITDVYAFPGSTADRIVLVMTSQSPISPANTAAARFDANALYQIKIDNTGDAVEDLVIQFQFDDTQSGGQQVGMFGPIAPTTRGMLNRVAKTTPDIVGAMGGTLTTGTGAAQVQLFTGPRNDPFYIDLEQFFRIIPDRRPARGPASMITKSANAFRPASVSNPGPFDATRGPAVDFLMGFNAMAIVVELPESALRSTTGGNNIGVWTTVSR
jgi:hypothetical protein